MKYEDVKEFIGKKVKILLKNGYRYTCIIKSSSEETIKIIDRYNHSVAIDLVDISMVTGVDDD